MPIAIQLRCLSIQNTPPSPPSPFSPKQGSQKAVTKTNTEAEKFVFYEITWCLQVDSVELTETERDCICRQDFDLDFMFDEVCLMIEVQETLGFGDLWMLIPGGPTLQSKCSMAHLQVGNQIIFYKNNQSQRWPSIAWGNNEFWVPLVQESTTVWPPMEGWWHTEQESCSPFRCLSQCLFGSLKKKEVLPNIFYTDFGYQDLAGLQVLLTNTGVARNTKALVQRWDKYDFVHSLIFSLFPYPKWESLTFTFLSD